jgi:hypothetical protein
MLVLLLLLNLVQMQALCMAMRLKMIKIFLEN